MQESTVTDRPVMRWSVGVDASGRTRLEAHWVLPGERTQTGHDQHVVHAA